MNYRLKLFFVCNMIFFTKIVSMESEISTNVIKEGILEWIKLLPSDVQNLIADYLSTKRRESYGDFYNRVSSDNYSKKSEISALNPEYISENNYLIIDSYWNLCFCTEGYFFGLPVNSSKYLIQSKQAKIGVVTLSDTRPENEVYGFALSENKQCIAATVDCTEIRVLRGITCCENHIEKEPKSIMKISVEGFFDITKNIGYTVSNDGNQIAYFKGHEIFLAKKDTEKNPVLKKIYEEPIQDGKYSSIEWIAFNHQNTLLAIKYKNELSKIDDAPPLAMKSSWLRSDLFKYLFSSSESQEQEQLEQPKKIEKNNIIKILRLADEQPYTMAQFLKESIVVKDWDSLSQKAQNIEKK